MTEAELPIHAREVLSPSGTRVKALHVYCPSRVRSVDLATCLACPHLKTCAPDAGAPGATLSCAAPEPFEARQHTPPRHVQDLLTRAAGSTVGEMMGARVTCVEPLVSLADAEAELARSGLELLPVVGQGARFLGVFWRADLLPPRLVEALALRDRRRGRRATSAGERMDPRISAVRESAPVTHLLRAMASRHTRSVTVVSELDTVVGSVTDLELLKWFASA